VKRLPIVRLQVQTDRIKVGVAPLRRYDPAVLESVPRLEISPSGVVGLGRHGRRLLDVHHRDHPHTRDPRGRAGLSVLGTGDYAALRARYGPHLTEGIAGEGVLLDAPAGLAGRLDGTRWVLHTAAGPIEVGETGVAEPCVEFTRFCLRLPPSPDVGPDVREHLERLDHGARGYKGVAAGSGILAVGDLVEIQSAGD